MISIESIAAGLDLGADGIWRAADPRGVSYPVTGNEECFAIEERSFWFQHRNACIAAAIERHPPIRGEPIFDIGGGNGFVSVALQEMGFEVVLVEPGTSGAMRAKQRGIRTVICATLDAAMFDERALGAVGLFDVIEHLEDEAGSLRSIRRLLKAGGRLYATVPAYQALWSEEDESAGHFRRYTSRSITGSLCSAGFAIEYATYFFRPLPIPIFFVVRFLIAYGGERLLVRIETRPRTMP